MTIMDNEIVEPVVAKAKTKKAPAAVEEQAAAIPSDETIILLFWSMVQNRPHVLTEHGLTAQDVEHLAAALSRYAVVG